MSGRAGAPGGLGADGSLGCREPNQRFSSLIHDSELFLTKLREFKPQSLGCLEARRKSSSTLIFPSPQQACMGAPKCPQYPHNVKPTPGYWIECHGPGALIAKPPAPQVASSGLHLDRRSSAARLGLEEGASREAGGFSRAGAYTSVSEHQALVAVGGHEAACEENVRGPGEAGELQQHGLTGSGLGDVPTARGQLKDGRETSCADKPRLIPARSTSELSLDSAATEMHRPPAAVCQEGEPERAGGQEARRRLYKRTMTRDDIDLHKTRRGTPNITITEPSFNQSITVQQLRGGFSRQGSQSQSQSQQQQPIRFRVQRYTSLENQQSQDEVGSSEHSRESSARGPTSSRCEEEFERAWEEEEAGTGEKHFNAPTQADDHLEEPRLQEFSHRQQQYHRPSVICEDVVNEILDRQQQQQQQEKPESIAVEEEEEEEEEADTRQQAKQAQQQLQRQCHIQSTDSENKELYCGLSTKDYTKKPQQAPFTQDQFRESSLELISFEEENYEKHYYGREHWNYFTNDELLGPVMLSLKQEVNNQRDHFHVLLRTVSYTLHGTIPASTICADRYDREAIVRELSEIAKLKPPLMLGQLPSTPDELLKLDHIFIKTELKVGVIYIKAGQEESEEAILGNREESPLFAEFLDLLGDRITLKGFDRYKGGLDTVHNLTGIESVYTMWRNIEIMFHVSTMLPHEENDPQKLQKKRHIGNDIVCVAFIESDDTLFWPGCIKSYFLHTFIAVRTSPKPLKEGEKRKYTDEFFKSDYFREWLLVKIVNGERASYSAPKFARMQDRTRSQLLEDIITNLANHLVTGQIPKPYRRGSWRPLGHTRASSPLEDSMKDYFEDYDQLAKDFCNAFCGSNKSVLCDVAFRVKDTDGSLKLVHGVRAIMAIRSRTFLEMLYGFVPPGTGPSSLQNQTSLRAIEMKALSGESAYVSGRDAEGGKNLLAKRGSVGADSSRKTGEKERRQSMLPNLSKNIAQKPNYLTVPNTGSGAGAPASGSTGGMIKNAFNRLVSGNWSGWSGNIKGYKGEPMQIKVDQNKTKVDLNSLAICKEIAKIDADKLTQREFEIKEFDYETFQQTIEYIHNGQCKLSYETIPGLICAAEHYDLPDLLHACFHHANTHMKLSAAPKMMNALYQNSCFYITAMQLLDSIYEYIDPHANEFFSRPEYLELYESVFTSLLCRKSLQISELRKFQAMDGWARQQVANKQQRQMLQRKQSAENQQEKQQAGGDSMFEQSEVKVMNREEAEQEYRNLMIRLNKEINIKLDKISSEDLVKVVLPTKVFSNDKIFEVQLTNLKLDEQRNCERLGVALNRNSRAPL